MNDQTSKQSRAESSPSTLVLPDNSKQPQSSKASSQVAGLDIGLSPLALDGWLEFTRLKWNVRPRRLRFPGPDTDQASIDAVIYLDQGGQVYNPPRNPYLPVRFQSTPTVLRYRLMRQWLEVSTMLAEETRRLGLRNTLNLPPNVTDVRPWQWAGFRAGVRYTLAIDFPFDVDSTEKTLGRTRRKAEQQGFRCDRTVNMHDVVACLADSEERQQFSLGLSVADLELAASLLGEEHFRAYVCYAPNGEPASASIALHRPGAPTIGWLGGTRTAYLRTSPMQVLEFFTIADLERNGATRYDLSGANLPTIAAAKTSWGTRLEPYYTIESYSARKLARWTQNWWKFRREGRTR